MAAKLGSSTALAQGSLALEVIRGRVRAAVAAGKATGVAISVVDSGRILWEEGFGWSNREANLKATPHTPFSMASLTKPFTTTTLLTLVEQGKLSLDAPANLYLEHSGISGTNGNPAATTVRMLGAHVSGLPGMYESYEASEEKLIPSPDALLEAYGRLAYPPGTWYDYSNIGYAALNAIAFAITKTEFGELMHRRVLAPLGLRDSFFGSDAARVQSGATRYDPLGHPIPHYRTSTPASGELYASAHDLATFLLRNMQGSPGRTGVLSRWYVSELQQPVFTGPSGIASTFGWFRGQTPSGIPFFFKSGGDPGVANRICFVPSRNAGCVVVTNQSNAVNLAHSICDEVMKHYLADWHHPEEFCGSPKTPLSPSSAFQGRWRGTLQNGGADMPVSLVVNSGESATLALGADTAEAITEIRAEGRAFIGLSTGRINSPDALRTHATTLQLQLLPHESGLVGAVFAVAGDANFRSVRLPYVVALRREVS